MWNAIKSAAEALLAQDLPLANALLEVRSILLYIYIPNLSYVKHL